MPLGQTLAATELGGAQTMPAAREQRHNQKQPDLEVDRHALEDTNRAPNPPVGPQIRVRADARA